MTAAKCPACHAETSDWLLCHKCTTELEANLRALPEWLGYLDDAMARDVQTGTGNGKRPSAITPLPYDERASKTRAYVRNQLSTWAAEINAGDREIADNPRAWCMYLARNVGVIRASPAANEMFEEVTYCIGLIQEAIDLPPTKVYLGACDADAPDGAICETPLYAEQDDKVLVCIGCGIGYDVETRRNEMLNRIEHQWGSIGTCAHVLNLFGMDIKSETVRSWTKPRNSAERTLPAKLYPKGQDQSGVNLYRIGDVMVEAKKLLQSANDKRAKKVERAAKRSA